MTSIYLESGDILVLEGYTFSEPIVVVNGSTLHYGANQTDTGVLYYKNSGGTVQIDAGVTLTSNQCYFNDVELEDNTTGPTYYVDSIGSGGAWIVNGFGGVTEDTDKAYITKNGLKVVTHRLLTNIYNGTPAYAGKISKIRLWYDNDSDGSVDSWIEAPLQISYVDDDTSLVDYMTASSTVEDEELGNFYDTIGVHFKFVIPESKFSYVDGSYTLLTSNIDVLKIEMLTETDTVFATTDERSSAIMTVDKSKRYTISWDVLIGNDTAPPEWSGLNRNCFTKFGLYLIANKLIYDDNYSPVTVPPVGVYLNSYQDSYSISQVTDDIETYIYDDSGSSWDICGSLANVQASDIIQILSERKFSVIYFDRAVSDGKFTFTVKYYNGSSWVPLKEYSDGTESFSKDGHFEFLMPHDWTVSADPYDGTKTGYSLRFEVTSDSTATGYLYGYTSYIFLAVVDTDIYSPSYILTQNKSVYTPLDTHAPVGMIWSKFSPEDIGFVKDDDGYLVSGETNIIRGISLSTVDAIKEKVQLPVAVDVSSSQVSEDYINIDATDNPKPDIILALYDRTTGVCANLDPDTIDIRQVGLNWRISGYLNLNSSHDYRLWYLPRVIDMSDEAPKYIRKVLGPTQTKALPQLVTSGLVMGDWNVRTPTEIVNYMIENNSTNIEDAVAWVSDIRSRKVGTAEAIGYNVLAGTAGFAGLVNTARFARSKIENTAYEPIPDHIEPGVYKSYGPRRATIVEGYDELEANKRVIKAGNENYIYSFVSDGSYPAIFMSFPNPGVLPGREMKLQMSLDMYNSLHVNGADVYVWIDTTSRWEKIGQFDINYGRYRQEMKTFSITTDTEIVGSEINVMVISQIPNFSKAHGIIAERGIPEENLNMPFNQIYEKLTEENVFTQSKGIASHVSISSSDIKLNSMYARIISYGSFQNGLTRLEDGIDYTWDEDSKEITLQTVKDLLSEQQKRQIKMVGKRFVLTPMIGWITEQFYDIGKLGSSAGKWNNDDDIEDDWSSGNFNFEFALAKIPYTLRNGVGAVLVYGKEYSIPPQNIRIAYKDDYEYGGENDYRDNRIKRHENGHGCYVAQIDVSDPITWANVTDDDDIRIIISYPYLLDNYYLVEYLDDVDYGVVGKALREQNTFSTPNRISQRDVGYYGVQIETRWPRGLEPDNS